MPSEHSNDHSTRTPSVWPARHIRRQAAVARDLEKIDMRMKSIEESIAALAAKVEAVLERVVSDLPSKSRVLELDFVDLSSRVTRMELLLLRTSMEDFRILDTSIAEQLPSTRSMLSLAAEEPEQEKSPPCGITPSVHVALRQTVTPRCIVCDISDNDPPQGAMDCPSSLDHSDSGSQDNDVPMPQVQAVERISDVPQKQVVEKLVEEPQVFKTRAMEKVVQAAPEILYTTDGWCEGFARAPSLVCESVPDQSEAKPCSLEELEHLLQESRAELCSAIQADVKDAILSFVPSVTSDKAVFGVG